MMPNYVILILVVLVNFITLMHFKILFYLYFWPIFLHSFNEIFSFYTVDSIGKLEF